MKDQSLAEVLKILEAVPLWAFVVVLADQVAIVDRQYDFGHMVLAMYRGHIVEVDWRAIQSLGVVAEHFRILEAVSANGSLLLLGCFGRRTSH